MNSTLLFWHRVWVNSHFNSLNKISFEFWLCKNTRKLRQNLKKKKHFSYFKLTIKNEGYAKYLHHDRYDRNVMRHNCL